MQRRWLPGESVVLRQRFRGRIWGASPAVVAADDEEQLALWLPPKRRWQGHVHGDLLGDWTLGERLAGSGGMLRLTRPGEPWSIVHFFHKNGSFRGWYFNLEQPLVRTALGFDFEDEILDLWVEADRTWKWLDEDELAEAVRRGIVQPEDAEGVRARGERALAELDRLLPTGWEEWRPDPGWSVPELPPGWDS